jgi:hypothetical protein
MAEIRTVPILRHKRDECCIGRQLRGAAGASPRPCPYINAAIAIFEHHRSPNLPGLEPAGRALVDSAR